jgi:hypothetical protein
VPNRRSAIVSRELLKPPEEEEPAKSTLPDVTEVSIGCRGHGEKVAKVQGQQEKEEELDIGCRGIGLQVADAPLPRKVKDQQEEEKEPETKEGDQQQQPRQQQQQLLTSADYCPAVHAAAAPMNERPVGLKGQAVISEKALAAIAVPDGHLRVELQRTSPSTMWGFIWDSHILEKKSMRVLERVLEGSPVDEWNQHHPEQLVKPGDILLKVNEWAEQLETQTVELRRNHIICEFKPANGGNSAVGSHGTERLLPQKQLLQQQPLQQQPQKQQQCQQEQQENVALAPLSQRLELPKSVAANAYKNAASSLATTPAATRSRFEAELSRETREQRWGFIWDPKAVEKRNMRVVERITAGSIADQWNQANPEHQIRPGDQLVSINGKSGRMEVLTIELQRQLLVQCEFEPVDHAVTKLNLKAVTKHAR